MSHVRSAAGIFTCGAAFATICSGGWPSNRGVRWCAMAETLSGQTETRRRGHISPGRAVLTAALTIIVIVGAVAFTQRDAIFNLIHGSKFVGGTVGVTD